MHQPVSRGFAVFADAWLLGWLAVISADLRETVAHQRWCSTTMRYTNPRLLYLLTLLITLPCETQHVSLQTVDDIRRPFLFMINAFMYYSPITAFKAQYTLASGDNVEFNTVDFVESRQSRTRVALAPYTLATKSTELATMSTATSCRIQEFKLLPICRRFRQQSTLLPVCTGLYTFLRTAIVTACGHLLCVRAFF